MDTTEQIIRRTIEEYRFLLKTWEKALKCHLDLKARRSEMVVNEEEFLRQSAETLERMDAEAMVARAEERKA